MSRPDRIALRWSIVSVLPMAMLFVVLRLSVSSVRADPEKHFLSWALTLLADMPVAVFAMVRLFRIGCEDPKEEARPSEHDLFWVTILMASMMGFVYGVLAFSPRPCITALAAGLILGGIVQGFVSLMPPGFWAAVKNWLAGR